MVKEEQTMGPKFLATSLVSLERHWKKRPWLWAVLSSWYVGSVRIEVRAMTAEALGFQVVTSSSAGDTQWYILERVQDNESALDVIHVCNLGDGFYRRAFGKSVQEFLHVVLREHNVLELVSIKSVPSTGLSPYIITIWEPPIGSSWPELVSECDRVRAFKENRRRR